MTIRSGMLAAGLLVTVGAGIAFGGGALTGGSKVRGKFTTVNGTGWLNSLDDAKAEAKRTGKPILLLSMFGKLDEEMPCANARTLRATLFKDPDFKAFAKNDVVLAWEMVRPVPHVTIDLGDGKRVVRTVRGNAVMYLLNAEGKVFDAFPGVYTKEDFLPAARESIEGYKAKGESGVLAFHKAMAQVVGPSPITRGKAVLESPTLQLIGARAIQGASVPRTTDPAKLAFYLGARNLTDLSLTPMSTKQAVAATLGPNSPIKDPKEIARQIILADSRLNIERTRPVVHLWLASEKRLPTPAEARDAVLGTILKIPYKDPYLGLRDVLLPGTAE